MRHKRINPMNLNSGTAARLLAGWLALSCATWGRADDPTVTSAMVAYQFQEPAGNSTSAVVSYQYFEWPDGSNPQTLASASVSFVFETPLLGFTRTANGLALQWPAGFTLQTAFTLSEPGQWSKVTDQPILENNQNHLLIEFSGVSQYFRLILP